MTKEEQNIVAKFYPEVNKTMEEISYEYYGYVDEDSKEYGKTAFEVFSRGFNAESRIKETIENLVITDKHLVVEPKSAAVFIILHGTIDDKEFVSLTNTFIYYDTYEDDTNKSIKHVSIEEFAEDCRKIYGEIESIKSYLYTTF